MMFRFFLGGVLWLFLFVPAQAITCNLKEKLEGGVMSYMDEVVLVQGNIFPSLTVKSISLSSNVLSQCYELRGEWRCGSVPEVSMSNNFPGNYLEVHDAAIFYAQGSDFILGRYKSWIDNARPQPGGATYSYLNTYTQGRYTCK